VEDMFSRSQDSAEIIVAGEMIHDQFIIGVTHGDDKIFGGNHGVRNQILFR
jgi:hypothetical protein